MERGIPYCREDFFRGESFRDVAEMQARAVVWCRDIAGTRVPGTTRVEGRGDSRLVRIYHRGALIKVHPPQPPGGRSTDYPDYPAERAPTPCAPRTPASARPSRSGPPSGSS